VTDLLLRNIGLEDCRNSLFERLYKSSPDTCRSILHKQGRMHPAIAEFPNQTFYYREQLESVPLPHQLEETPYEAGLTPQDTIDQLLLERRMVFIPAEAPDHLTCSDKTNPNEARIVATLLGHIYRLTESRFDPNRTVGVIVPYRNQIAMIRKEIARLQLPALQDISIDTVERYQGSQRDIIIYSFTIQNFSQLNFLTANTFQEGNFLIDRKLNVALTRARKQLLLTGNPHILGANITFYKLMEYIRLHNGYLETDALSFCRGDFTLPSYQKNWEVADGTYSLPAHFKQVFSELIAPPKRAPPRKNWKRSWTALKSRASTSPSSPARTTMSSASWAIPPRSTSATSSPTPGSTT
jgi:superfamily I DNA and/or RNA helicase